MGAQGALYTMEHSARAEESQHVSQEAVKRDRAPSELSLTPTEILAAANRWRPGGKTAASIVEEAAEIGRHRQNCSSGVGEAGNEVADNEVWFSGIWPGRGGGEIEEEDGRDWTWTYSTYSPRHSSEGTSTYLRRKEKHKKKKKKEEEKKEEEKKEEEKKEKRKGWKRKSKKRSKRRRKKRSKRKRKRRKNWRRRMKKRKDWRRKNKKRSKKRRKRRKGWRKKFKKKSKKRRKSQLRFGGTDKT